MGEAKPLASLSGILLARKGSAKPAMRRPSIDGSQGKMNVNDDLGWNDMGYDVDPDQNAPMDHDHNPAINPLANAVPDVKPDVRQQQEMIARQLEDPAEAGFETVPSFAADEGEPAENAEDAPIDESVDAPMEQAVEAAPRIEKATIATSPILPKVKAQRKKRAAPGSKEKAAFTLRLDKERHLKLRLACAVNNRSAQNLVTDALDAFLENMPDISQLAAQVPSK